MERLRLWRYRKLTNENVKDEKVIEKYSDDEDYNSCFKLKRNIKKCHQKLVMKQHVEAKKLTVNDSPSVKMEEKLIRNLKDKKREADENRKSLNKRLRKILSKNHCMHEQLQDVDENKTKSDDAYLRSGIYDKFGNSCTESLKQYEPVKQEVEAEDLTSASWYHSRIIGKFSEEILHHQSPGSFIIHKASHKSANFILSLRVPSKTSKVVHHLIVQSKRGYRLKGASKNFSTITSLVTHHSVMAEQLPVALSLQRTYDLVYKTVNKDDFSSTEDLGIIFTDLEV